MRNERRGHHYLPHGHVKEYYGQFYDSKLNNLDKMNQLPERHKLPKLTQGEIGNVNSLYLFFKLNQ